MNAEKKWYHALMEDVYSGEQYILGVQAYNEDHAHKMVFHEKHEKFGDEAMFHISRTGSPMPRQRPPALMNSKEV